MNSDTLQHSGAQVLAYAVRSLYPLSRRVGYMRSRPGFLYTFAFPEKAGLPDRSAVEEKIRSCIKEDLDIQSIEMMGSNLAGVFEDQLEYFLAQEMEEEADEVLEVLRIYDFFAPCPGPHLGSLDGFTIKILDEFVEPQIIEGKQWNLVTIEGTLQKEGRELRKFTKTYDDWNKFRHQELGERLKLFLPTSTNEWIWLPKGMTLRKLLQARVEGLWPVGVEVQTPDTEGEYDLRVPAGKGLLHLQLWKIQGQAESWISSEWSHYGQDSGGRQSLLKSERFTQDECFFIEAENPAGESLKRSLHSIWETITILGIEVKVYLISEPQRSRWRNAQWDKARQELETCAQSLDILCHSDPTAVAIGGPRIQLRYIDKLGNEWDGPFLQREVLTAEMLGSDRRDSSQTQVLMHSCSYLGPLETVIALLLESHNGRLPLRWAPEQLRLITVGTGNESYVEQVEALLRDANLRIGKSDGPEALGEKIFQAEEAEIPLLLVIGEKEAKKGEISVRQRGSKEQKCLSPSVLLDELKNGLS